MVPEVLQGCPLQHRQGQEETFNMTNANDFYIHSTLLILRMREVFSVLLDVTVCMLSTFISSETLSGLFSDFRPNTSLFKRDFWSNQALLSCLASGDGCRAGVASQSLADMATMCQGSESGPPSFAPTALRPGPVHPAAALLWHDGDCAHPQIGLPPPVHIPGVLTEVRRGAAQRCALTGACCPPPQQTGPKRQ